jgi:hypothetical protein
MSGTKNRLTYIVVCDVVMNFDSMERFSTQLTIRDTSTNTWFTYPTTAEAQKIAYDGNTIKQITAEDSGFTVKNDYFLLMTTGDNINSLSMTFHYDPVK